jgi:hypothetical protein
MADIASSHICMHEPRAAGNQGAGAPTISRGISMDPAACEEAVVLPHAQATAQIPQQCEEAVARIHHIEPALAPMPQHAHVAALHRAGGNEGPDPCLEPLPSVCSKRDVIQASLSGAPQGSKADDLHGVPPLSMSDAAAFGPRFSVVVEMLSDNGMAESSPMGEAAAKHRTDTSHDPPVCNTEPPQHNALMGPRVQRHFLVRSREVRPLFPGMCGSCLARSDMAPCTAPPFPGRFCGIGNVNGTERQDLATRQQRV